MLVKKTSWTNDEEASRCVMVHFRSSTIVKTDLNLSCVRLVTPPPTFFFFFHPHGARSRRWHRLRLTDITSPPLSLSHEWVFYGLPFSAPTTHTHTHIYFSFIVQVFDANNIKTIFCMAKKIARSPTGLVTWSLKQFSVFTDLETFKKIDKMCRLQHLRQAWTVGLCTVLGHTLNRARNWTT